MAELYSRRSFLAGVLTAGMLSAATGYLLTRREPVTLTLATGAEPTGGGRNLLINLWNDLHPDVRIVPKEINSSTQDQFAKFTENRADIYNLDAIHIPRFAEAGRIDPIVPRNDISLLGPVRRVCQVEGETERLWAVPFNADVGMLYRRVADKRAADSEPGLDDVLATGSFTGQLDTVGVQTDEAFVINVLEHALAQDDAILDADGVVSYSLGQWKTALAPLADALRSRKVDAQTGEEDTVRAFQRDNLRYMRNWPVWFPGVDRQESAEPETAAIRLGRLPVGVLGGQSLAVDRDTPHREEAEQVIHFLTDTPAQKLLATYGFAPTGLDAYIDEELEDAAPQLSIVRYAVEGARPRPVHSGYAAFAQRFKEHTHAYLYQGEQLTQRFVQDMQEALR
ncbi:extracellular solute-binding protein [Actinoplanes sp. NPDC051861]|uniref:extracellular solute-binding protein n=1 Tax=Actinoplanes sp. NPDC051861 TaxID=3155170 RepID=UPI00343AF67B